MSSKPIGVFDYGLMYRGDCSFQLLFNGGYLK